VTGIIALLNCTLDDFPVFIGRVDVAWPIPYISNSIFLEIFEFEAFFDEGNVRWRSDLCRVRFPLTMTCGNFIKVYIEKIYQSQTMNESNHTIPSEPSP